MYLKMMRLGMSLLSMGCNNKKLVDVYYDEGFEIEPSKLCWVQDRVSIAGVGLYVDD